MQLVNALYQKDDTRRKSGLSTLCGARQDASSGAALCRTQAIVFPATAEHLFNADIIASAQGLQYAVAVLHRRKRSLLWESGAIWLAREL